MTPEEQKNWEKKLTQYALIITTTSTALLEIDKLVRKEMKGPKLAVVDSLIRALYAGLESCQSLLSDAMAKVKAGKMPDFNGDVAFPKPLPNFPANNEDMPSWFMLNWEIIESTISLVATKNPKLAIILPPIEAGGRELVNELQHYFPLDKKLSASVDSPDFPTD